MLETLSKEQSQHLIQRLSELLPEWFQVYLCLQEMANRDSREIHCSINDLAKKVQRDPQVVYAYLLGLETLKFIQFENSKPK